MSNLLFKDAAHHYIGCWGVVSNSTSKAFTNGKYAFSGELYHEFMCGKLVFKPFLSVLVEGCFSKEQETVLKPLIENSENQWNQVFTGGEMFHYLLKWRFDVFGLIESGQALKS